MLNFPNECSIVIDDMRICDRLYENMLLVIREYVIGYMRICKWFYENM